MFQLAEIEPKIRSLGARHSWRTGTRRARNLTQIKADSLSRIGVSNLEAARSALVIVLNQAVSLRTHKAQMTRRVEELETEIASLQAEADTGASRLEVVQRDSDRRLISVESVSVGANMWV